HIKQLEPTGVVNCAAYTDVDRAEGEREVAFMVIRDAVASIGLGCSKVGARLIHISTDFVFDGTKGTPYRPDDEPNPLNVYGASKLAGEQVLIGLIRRQSMIIRTSWLYSADGSNFVKTMLRLMSEREVLSVVDDQYGSPTYAEGLADAIWRIIEGNLFKAGIFHWTDNGVTSWYEFARAIHEEAMDLGLLDRDISINPITSDAYRSPARRAAFSALNTDSMHNLINTGGASWRANLKRMLALFPR
ncbi:MAG: dTDP-4-dehydrorhamnose reductase, partial [Arenicellales bacterium]|nr:dTDP-4-dehydrorhamnose reductase [Arenicellales bacterium]